MRILTFFTQVICLAVLFIGVLLFKESRAETNLSSSLAELNTANRKLAAACYAEGFAKGQLVQAVTDLQIEGAIVSPAILAKSKQPRTLGCQ